MVNKTVKMDNKTVEMDNKTAEIDNNTVEMDNKTVEMDKPKETFLGTLFNTNNVSLMVVSVVSLILITLMIVFAHKLIRKKSSQRRIFNCHHKEKLPDDSMQELFLEGWQAISLNKKFLHNMVQIIM